MLGAQSVTEITTAMNSLEIKLIKPLNRQPNFAVHFSVMPERDEHKITPTDGENDEKSEKHHCHTK